VLRVELGDRSYSVRVGQLAGLGSEWPLPVGRAVLISNDRVGPLHGDAAEASLRRAGLDVARLELPDGERNKTLATWQALVGELLDLEVDRSTALIALGGGVTCDIVGFAAATTLRGLPFVSCPTSLLAMVDASVGGKTGVNTPAGKNLVGAFHQPSLVHIGLDTLATLEDAEYRCGLGEVVKHAVLADAEFFAWLEQRAPAVLARDPDTVAHLVQTCCAIKAAVVAEDELELGRRAVLNCGHTLGHAIERVLGFGSIRHGEAVAIGMVAEAEIAVARGEASSDLRPRIEGLLRALGLPTRVQARASALVGACRLDKKRRHGKVRVAYPVEIGRVRFAEVSQAELTRAAAVVSKER
jgi:3-dehydroquinate synthase